MRKFLKSLGRIVNWLTLFLVLLFVIGLLWDTIESFVNPEKYRHVQYQENWINEGFWLYVLKNVALIVASAIFWLSALKKLRNKNILWNRLYYSFWVLILAGMIYNRLIK
jgi:hypothetical protein